ncbi:MAG: aminotransferase class V-fold PLP-dependent enzyme [Ignavibacteriae bacterium]|nr:aminotransferase class V-fold PLP-dependent enzyme [Ignavibacteriota bacterium]
MNNAENLIETIEKIEDARKIFPVTESCVYLDSAHYSQYSLETNRRLVNFINEFTYTNKNLSTFVNKKADVLKEKIAKIINAGKENIIITGSTTHGLNIFANGINLKAGERVAFADSEFPAVVYPWLNQNKLKGTEYVYIPSENGKIRLEDIESIITENNVKVLTISSVEFLGFRNNLSEISRICTENNCILLVDAIQSLGVCPMDVQKYKIDFLAAGAQKWMMSPAGIGFAYISDRMRSVIVPTYASTSVIKYDFKNFLEYELNFRDDASAYENSTHNCLGMIGLESTMDLFLKIGVQNIFSHIIGLLDEFISGIDLKKYNIESSLKQENRSNILIFSHKERNRNDEIQKYLESKKIFIALREGFLRVSPHLFNNAADIRIFLKELNGI